MQQATLDRLAAESLHAYSVCAANVEFLRHGDAATYKVEADSGRLYLLRLHIPVTAALGTHGGDPIAVASEISWLEALGRETDLVLQRPVRTRDEGLVARIPSSGGALTNVSLLTWVEGVGYCRDLETEATASQIGATLATLHNHASTWRPPADFRRPRRDAAYFHGTLRALEPAVADGRIRRSDFDELGRAITRLVDLLPSWCGEQDRFVLHADAHKGNMLWDEGRIRLIDFSFCAIAEPAFDLGICFGDMKREFHRACLDGYRGVRTLPQDYAQRIEACFVGSIVGAFAHWVGNPRAQELLVSRVPRIVTDFAVPFNRGEDFWSL